MNTPTAPATRPERPPDEAPHVRLARQLRHQLMSDDEALSAGRKLARLVTEGRAFDDPEVDALATGLRTHLERLLTRGTE